MLLLTDKEGGVGAMLVESRIQGPVGGTGEPLLPMKYVATDDKVNVGEKVVTSGMDKIFPRDIPVGTVQEVKPGNPFKQIWLKPAAKLERLEEVIVLLSQEPVEFAKEPYAQSAAGGATGNGNRCDRRNADFTSSQTGEAMNETYDLRGGETHIEVHKFYPGAIRGCNGRLHWYCSRWCRCIFRDFGYWTCRC